MSWYKHAWGKLILWATGITVRTANISFSPALLSFKLLAVPTPCAVHTICFPDFISLAVISHLYSIQNPGFLHFVPRPRLRRPPPLLRRRAPLHTQAPRLREAGNGEAGDLTNHLFNLERQKKRIISHAGGQRGGGGEVHVQGLQVRRRSKFRGNRRASNF